MKSGAPPASLAFATIPDPPRDVAKLGELEEIFQAWGGYAVWSNGVTQFALWNGETDAHTDFYEVRRANRRFYFRTLPRADWPLIDHGEMVRCPMWFAETPAMRERFYREHPEEKPGRPVLRRWPERPPLLPPLPPKEGESPATGSPLSPSPGGGEQLVPPWEATPPAHN
ncbi:MAG: hypothetical protein WDM96_16570 [Lacunisphaera sp.]